MGSLPYVAPIDVNSLPPIVVNVNNIESVDRVKNLGVWITSTLGSPRGQHSIKGLWRFKFPQFPPTIVLT